MPCEFGLYLHGETQPIEPIFELVTAHAQKRHRQLGGIGAGEKQIIVDEFAGGITCSDEFAGKSFIFAKAQRFLFLHQHAKARVQVFHGRPQRSNAFPLGSRLRRRYVVERLQGHVLPLGKIPDFPIGGMRHKARSGCAHHQEAGFEIAAGVGRRGVPVHAGKSAAYLVIADCEGNGDGEKRHHGNGNECNNARAYRQSWQHAKKNLTRRYGGPHLPHAMQQGSNHRSLKNTRTGSRQG